MSEIPKEKNISFIHHPGVFIQKNITERLLALYLLIQQFI